MKTVATSFRALTGRVVGVFLGSVFGRFFIRSVARKAAISEQWPNVAAKQDLICCKRRCVGCGSKKKRPVNESGMHAATIAE